MSEVTVTSLSKSQNEVRYGADHSFITDEPISAGGEDDFARMSCGQQRERGGEESEGELHGGGLSISFRQHESCIAIAVEK